MKKLKEEELTLSVIIPCYNEKRTIQTVIQAVRECGVSNIEIIIVDDCSTDGTRKVLEEVVSKEVDKVIYHTVNQGKGAALRDGIKAAAGDLVIIQDADMEYDPKDYVTLIQPFVKGRGDAEVC